MVLTKKSYLKNHFIKIVGSVIFIRFASNPFQKEPLFLATTIVEDRYLAKSPYVVSTARVDEMGLFH